MLNCFQVEREIVEVLMKALQQLEPELAHLDSSGQRWGYK